MRGRFSCECQSITCVGAVVMSVPLMWTCPEDGRSRPTSIRSSVLFPEPEPPITTRVSFCLTSKVSPCRISRSPKRTRRSLAAMTGSGIALPHSSRRVEQDRKEQIDQHQQQERNHHCPGSGPADFFGAGAGRKALMTAHRRDRHAEDHALDAAAGEI